MLIFEERGKPENPEKNLSEQSKEPTTNLTHSWPRVLSQTRVTQVGGECNHHYAIPAPLREGQKVDPNLVFKVLSPASGSEAKTGAYRELFLELFGHIFGEKFISVEHDWFFPSLGELINYANLLIG